MEAMDFFRMSEGHWVSQRTTHHLAMRRTELGQLEINASVLEAASPKVAEICEMHDVSPERAIGGAAVSWQGSMQWDEEGQKQEGATVLVLIPDTEDSTSGQLLREKGYAETSPVIGRYQVDEQDGLILTTDYSTMSSVERFWFPNEFTRIRTSTVIGLSNTASFCVETRMDRDTEAGGQPASSPPATLSTAHYSVLGW
ncbi:phycobiliprotein lyase [Oscillatoria sp. CS-180]|uniref:phycobiliprotein lyase n=1 Tax=Oscillatoria sp. CS-180 TaxID=3021720 RepID=UPI0023300925|nr:phycobiliprotein lyase [Oscillatoria sp. CS-180]MDB9525062.1 phycobiliprotein lyase [Oscillatoria sp. CS-180]